MACLHVTIFPLNGCFPLLPSTKATSRIGGDVADLAMGLQAQGSVLTGLQVS
jgi:hypothetical protein